MEADIVAAVENEAVEGVVVEDVKNTVDASTLKNTQSPSAIEEKHDRKLVEDDIRLFVGEQNQQKEPTKDDEVDIEIVTNKVMEVSTEAPQNNGDGGKLSVDMPQPSQDHTIPGHSNVCIKKRRNVHILIFDKREILPRKSKTKAYEYLKNIARGLSATANPGNRRRVHRKRVIRNLRGNKSSPIRKRIGGKRPVVRRTKIGVRHSLMSISSGMSGITGSSYVSSRSNDRFA